jgi:hypothetical protein
MAGAFPLRSKGCKRARLNLFSTPPHRVNHRLALEAGVIGVGHFPFVDHYRAAEGALLENLQRLVAVCAPVAAPKTLGRAAGAPARRPSGPGLRPGNDWR